MATHQNNQSFYGEVDRYRFRTNWGCLGWLLIIVAVALLVTWWIWKKL